MFTLLCFDQTEQGVLGSFGSGVIYGIGLMLLLDNYILHLLVSDIYTLIMFVHLRLKAGVEYDVI